MARAAIRKPPRNGLSASAKRAVAQLQRAFPPPEWKAVSLWLGIFYPYQQEWLLDFTRFALLNKARQIGASHTYAAAAVLWSLLGETTTIVSVGEREAQEVLEKCARHCLSLERFGSAWAKLSTTNKTELRTASGGRIIALPSTSGGRGYSGNVLLDECAYYSHPEQVWDAAGGTVLHGYKLRAMSTPNGVGNLWHQLWSDPKQHDGYTLHEVTLDKAREQGLKVDDSECWRMSRGDPRVYDQLFRCKFLDGQLQYFASEILGQAFVDDAARRLSNTHPHEDTSYGGLDIGLDRDRTSLVIVQRGPSGYSVVHVESHPTTDDQLLDQLVEKALVFWRCRRLALDATGIGSIPAKRFKRQHGGKVEPVDFTSKSKEDLVTGLYQALASDGLKVPKSYVYPDGGQDEASKLRDDLSAIRRSVTAAGNVRYDAPRTSQGHADRAWALMLAVHAAGRMRGLEDWAPITFPGRYSGGSGYSRRGSIRG